MCSVVLCLLSLIVGLDNCVTFFFFLPSETNVYFFTSLSAKICVLSCGLKGKAFCFTWIILMWIEIHSSWVDGLLQSTDVQDRTPIAALLPGWISGFLLCLCKRLWLSVRISCTFQSVFIFAFHYQNKAVKLQFYIIAIHWNNSHEERFSHLNPLQQTTTCFSTYL